MPLISFIDGIKYIFRGHMVNYDEMYTNPELIQAKFSKLSKRLGYDVYLPEGIINYYGYLFLYTRPDIEKALFYFDYNTQNYPLSSNTWSSLAEAYKVKGDKIKAKELYSKTLKLNPENTEIRKRLVELKQKK